MTPNLRQILKQEASVGIDTLISGILNVTFVPKECGNIKDNAIGDWIIFNRIRVVYFSKNNNEPNASFNLRASNYHYTLLLFALIFYIFCHYFH